jgi:hypothetical protein
MLPLLQHFGSGASHGIYAQFIAQSTQQTMVELLDCFVVPAATFFYAML